MRHMILGGAFVSMLRSDLDEFRLPRKRYLSLPEQDRARRFRPLSCIEHIREGAQRGDADMLFAWAELLFWGCAFLPSGAVEFNFGDLAPQTVLEPDGDPFEAYVRAAIAGSAAAMCWLGWCCRHGIRRSRDESAAQMWFARARESEPLDSFEFTEYAAIAKKADLLEHIAEDEDTAEDMGGGSTAWRDTHGTALGVYDFGCALGDAACGLQRGMVFEYDDRLWWPYLAHRRLTAWKRLWMLWCALSGTGLARPADGELARWLTDADDALSDLRQWSDEPADVAELEAVRREIADMMA